MHSRWFWLAQGSNWAIGNSLGVVKPLWSFELGYFQAAAINRHRVVESMMLKGLFKPEYLLNPSRIISRLRLKKTAALPLKLTVLVRKRRFQIYPDEVIGRHLLHFGLFDLLVTEALLRLADAGEVAADIGANVGYMSVVLADAVGPAGRVFAFEPHPEIFADLRTNTIGLPVELIQAAVSDRSGVARLYIPSAFTGNRGVASLEKNGSTAGIEVKSVSLDQSIPDGQHIGVLKIDIEGHELAALRGAESLIQRKAIRDIIFEEHNPRDSVVAQYLIDCGYEVFLLHKNFLGPKLLDASSKVAISNWESPSLLATLDSTRARKRFAKRGWRALRNA